MVNVSKVLLVLFWLIFDRNLIEALYKCPKSSNCTCLELGTILEFTCLEDNDPNRNLLIEYQNRIVKLQCTHINNFNQDLLPQLNSSEIIETIEIKFCPLPSVGNFRGLFSNILNTTNVKRLIFRYTTNENQRLDKDLLEGFDNLELFDFSNNNFQDADEDVFSNTPKLTTINLSANRIRFKNHHFQPVKSLLNLNIADNRIVDLPNGIFQNLTNLNKLELWRNHLVALKSEIFDDLINLQVLGLSLNKLATIDGKVFNKLTNLQQLGLNNNELTELPVDLVWNNKNVESLRFENNLFKTLSGDLLKNSTKLKELDLSNCSLIDLPPGIFTNLNQLRVIKLHSNRLRHLLEDWFKSLAKIEEIHLNDNLIEDFINFPAMSNLELLNLRNNSLQQIKNDHLINLRNLKQLDLSWNSINNIQHGAFINNQKLIKLNLSHNMMNNQFLQSLNPFSYCTKLEQFDMSFNQIEQVDQTLILTMVHLRSINLSNNRLQFISSDFMTTLSSHRVEMDLSNNNIETIDFNIIELELYSEENKNDRGSIINLNNNPINCDCELYSMWRYFKNQLPPSIRDSITFVNDDLICMAPEPFKNVSIKLLKENQLICELEGTICLQNCICNWRPSDQSIIIDCSYRNLTKLPQHYHLPPFKGVKVKNIETHLEGNGLQQISNDTIPGYENVTKLFLSHNQIDDLDRLPPKLQFLDLRDNRISRIDVGILEKFQLFTNISLDNNPWICDCSADHFARFLRTNHDKINPTNIHCENTTTRLVDLSKNDLCKTKIIVIYTSGVLLIIGLFVSVVIAVYYRYQQEIKVWLYARNWCLWWVTEDELDKDKAYDAFISYANQDEDFVMGNLVKVLENGTNPYKLCLHKRDWIPGEFITKQIINSVQNSKRTIVVLSANFLDSVWAKMEFRTAHTQAMNEGRVRLIVVLLDDLLDLNQLDDEIKTYLKTNTYVKWGNPHFWNQLRYALPHTKQLTKHKENKRIDERSVITNGFASNPDTTPPVLTLDGGLLKNHPLNLTATLKQ